LANAAIAASRVVLIAGLKTSPNNCEILAFNEAPGAQLIEEGDAREPLAH